MDVDSIGARAYAAVDRTASGDLDTVSPRRRVLCPLPGAPPSRTTRPCTTPDDSLGWSRRAVYPAYRHHCQWGEICPRQLYVICHRLRALRDQCICADAALFLAAQPRRQLRGDEEGNHVPSSAIREASKRRGRVVFLQREEARSGSQLVGCFAALGSQRGDP